jgi:hypothetical protein
MERIHEVYSGAPLGYFELHMGTQFVAYKTRSPHVKVPLIPDVFESLGSSYKQE